MTENEKKFVNKYLEYYKNIMAIFHIRFGQKKVLVIIDSL